MMNIVTASNRQETLKVETSRSAPDTGMMKSDGWDESSLGQVRPGDTTLVDEVAHDFNNILYAINGFTELALRAVLIDANPYIHLMMVREAADRGTRLVARMLARSRRTAQPKFPIDIRPVVEETVKCVRAVAPEGVSVSLTMSDEVGPLLADATDIHQLLMNLCSNSAHSMKDKGGMLHVDLSRVEFTTEEPPIHQDLLPGSYLRFTVRDTGEGIEPHVVNHIFEPYFSTKKLGEGTGLGLSVVRRIVKAHQGALTVESTVGRGTAIQAFLPTIECASLSCPVRRMASFMSPSKEFDMGLLRDDLQHLRTDMEHVHSDIEHLEKDLTQCRVECGPHLSELRTHVRDLDAHLHDVLSHVMHVEEHSRVMETAPEATKEA